MSFPAACMSLPTRTAVATTLLVGLTATAAWAEAGIIALSPPAPEAVIDSARLQGDVANAYAVTIGGTVDGLFKVELRPTDRTMHPHLRLANGDAATLNETFAEEDGRVTRMEVPIGPGAYTLEVDDSHQVTRMKPYRLTARFQPVSDRFEPNNTFESAKPLTDRQPVDITLFRFRETDDDYFTYRHAGGVLMVDVSGHTGMTPQVKLFNPNREEVGFGVAANQAALLHYAEDQPAGDYILVVSDGAGSNLPTTLRLTASSH